MPVVIYFHCEAGVDRTGEIAGSYYFRWLGWSFQQALAYDNSIETRDMETTSSLFLLFISFLSFFSYFLFFF